MRREWMLAGVVLGMAACGRGSGSSEGAADCDMAAAGQASTQTYFPDRDGDGLGDPEAESSRVCSAGAVRNAEDCDDSDGLGLARVVTYPDADGDGLGDPQGAAAFGCDGSAGDGRVANREDCDDTDPSGVAVQTDEDEDTFYPPCAASPGRRIALLLEDCNDHDPGVHPLADELPFDDVDSNCDGMDFPLGDYLTVLYGGECPRLPEYQASELVAREGCDDKPDPFIVAVMDCWDCYAHHVEVVVANRGTAPVEAVLVFGHPESSVVLREVSLGTLEALSISPPVVVDEVNTSGDFFYTLLVRPSDNIDSCEQPESSPAIGVMEPCGYL